MRLAMAGSEKLVGVGCAGATVHGFLLREHREKEESKTNAIMSFFAVGEGLIPRAPWPAAMDSRTRVHQLCGEGCGRERGRWQAHRREGGGDGSNHGDNVRWITAAPVTVYWSVARGSSDELGAKWEARLRLRLRRSSNGAKSQESVGKWEWGVAWTRCPCVARERFAGGEGRSRRVGPAYQQEGRRGQPPGRLGLSPRGRKGRHAGREKLG